MLLYHYSKEKRPLLKTLEKQNKVTREMRIKEESLYVERCKTYGYLVPGYYYEHISFFFERPPIEKISSFYYEGHEVWKKGNDLYEHIVDSKKIGSFLYEVVESPEKTELYYNEKLSDKEYFKKVSDAIRSHLYIGKNNESLEIAISPLVGKTELFLSMLRSRPNFEEIKDKYAATVPHLMIYPFTGIIKPESISKVIVG